MTGTLTGDKSVSAVFDTTKIRRFVPDFRPVVPFAEGIRWTVAWFDADPARQQVDAAMDAAWDRLVAAYEEGLASAVARVAAGGLKSRPVSRESGQDRSPRLDFTAIGRL